MKFTLPSPLSSDPSFTVSRRRLLQGLLGAGLLWLPACKRAFTQAQVAPHTYVVEMKDFFYDPIGLYLRRGDTVVWLEAREQVKTRHTATAYHPAFDKKLRIPEGAAPWNSGFFEQIGQTWSYTFNDVGIHDYFCIPHEDSGMVGRLLVEEPTGPGAQDLSVGISPAGQSVMPTVEELLGPVGEVFNFQGRLNAVMLPWRQDDKSQALERWEALLAEGESLLPQFFANLSEADLQAVQAEFAAFGAAIASDASLFDGLEAAEALKLALEDLVYNQG